MEMRTFGRSGLQLSVLGFGCGAVGGLMVRGDHADQERSVALALGGVDGFDEDKSEGEGNKGAVVLGRLLAAERHALEALELAHKLLDAGAGSIERFREEARPVLGR